VALLYVRFNRCFSREDQAAVETAEVAGVLTPRLHAGMSFSLGNRRRSSACQRWAHFHIKLHRNSLKLPCNLYENPAKTRLVYWTN
jgi:hypothetical protein